MRRYLLLIPLLSGCGITIHQASLSDLGPYAPKVEHREVEASAEQFTIMGFSADNTHIDEAWTALQRECGRGTLTSILTKTSTQLGFFSWTNKVRFKALCVEAPPPLEPALDEQPSEPEVPEPAE